MLRPPQLEPKPFPLRVTGTVALIAPFTGEMLVRVGVTVAVALGALRAHEEAVSRTYKPMVEVPAELPVRDTPGGVEDPEIEATLGL